MAVDHAAACSSRILRAEKMASPIGGLAGGRLVVPPSLRLEGADILPRLRESMADKDVAPSRQPVAFGRMGTSGPRPRTFARTYARRRRPHDLTRG